MRELKAPSALLSENALRKHRGERVLSRTQTDQNFDHQRLASELREMWGDKLVVSAVQHVVFSYDSLDRLIQVSENTQTYSKVSQGPRLYVNVGFVCLCFF